eukprot:805767-Alexandrium_andersonii.AAC.1
MDHISKLLLGGVPRASAWANVVEFEAIEHFKQSWQHKRVRSIALDATGPEVCGPCEIYALEGALRAQAA